jgi:hypothetical protein
MENATSLRVEMASISIKGPPVMPPPTVVPALTVTV